VVVIAPEVGMTRANPRRGPHVQADKPAHPAEPPAAAEPADAAPAPPGLSRPWRVVLTFWVSAFVCLWMYELLSALFRALSRPAGH
jgi:hypothetical protein